MPDDLTIPTITNGCRVNKPGFEKAVCANQIDFQPFIQEILFISKQAGVVSFLRVWLSIHLIHLRIVLYLLIEAGTDHGQPYIVRPGLVLNACRSEERRVGKEGVSTGRI